MELGHSFFNSQNNTILGSINENKLDPREHINERPNVNQTDIIVTPDESAAGADLTAGAGEEEIMNRTMNELSRGGLSKSRIRNIDFALKRRKHQNLDPLRNPSEFRQEQAI